MKQKLTSIISVIIASFLFFGTATTGYAFQTVKQSYPVSQGVKYSTYTYLQSTNEMNHLEIDLSNPYTKVGLGLSNPINTLATTTAHANADSKEGNRVVGAINANFFNMGDGYPLYLIAQNNNIITPSVISDSSSNYVSQPIAFGITANGNAEIAYYNSDVVLNYNGAQVKLNGLNRARGSNEAIIYTPQHFSSITPNNEYGFEYIVETGVDIGSTKFGQTLTGKVTAIRAYGDKTKPKIPRNGFILSFNGSAWKDKLGGIKIGEELSVSFTIDPRWMDAQFMLASGPLLVLDGKANITMNTSSSRATEIAPRTAVAISADKKKVHFITVDGRQSNSVGMTLTQFANYLVSLGVDRAINLDGGGSTAMAIRKYGSNTVLLANNPSGGTERRVSAILEAISTGVTGTAKTMKVTRNQVGSLLVGATVKLTPEYVLDEHFNPLPVNASDFTITSINDKVSINGLSYTGEQAGDERLLVKNGGANQTITFSVVDAPASLTISGAGSNVEPNAKVQFTAEAKDVSGGTVIYSPSQLKWSIEGDIGSVSSTGLFTSNGKLGKGKIIATLGAKSFSKDIEVKSAFNEPIFSISQFENVADWRTENILATSNIALESAKSIGKQGSYSLKFSYDMTGNSTETAASYVRLNSLVQLPGKPKKIGVWLFGDGNATWVRGQVRDINGQKYTIDFTEQGGQTWTGWKYIEANLPTDVTYPLSFESIYLAQPDTASQKEGTIYLDKLQAVYSSSYMEPIFNDISNDNQYKTEIKSLVERGYINGYADGTFKPFNTLTRAHAAVLLSRALGLNTSKVTNPGFTDVPTTHLYYKEIAAMVNAGIMNGTGNSQFDPNAKLTRAQMAKILVVAFGLPKTTAPITFKDVSPSHWSYDYIRTLAANGITTGYGDGTFKPSTEVTRVHFSLFKYRSLTRVVALQK